MRPPPEIRLPSKPRWPIIAIAASVAVHLLLLFGWVEGRLPSLPRRPAQLIVLAPSAEGPRVVPMPYRTTPRAQGEQGRGVAPRPSVRRAADASAPVVVQPEPEQPSTPADTGAAAAPPSEPMVGLLRPGLGEGRLWVRPLPLPPQELAQRLRKTHAQLVDSAVTAVVQAYLDSIANDPASRNVGLPSWTKEIAGKKFGIDSKNIYIAGLKIPAAVLALIPIPAGNIDQNRAYNHLMDLRTDLQYAAQRSANLDEFKEMIKEMRLRKEREREFEKNQRTAPPPENPSTP